MMLHQPSDDLDLEIAKGWLAVFDKDLLDRLTGTPLDFGVRVKALQLKQFRNSSRHRRLSGTAIANQNELHGDSFQRSALTVVGSQGLHRAGCFLNRFTHHFLRSLFAGEQLELERGLTHKHIDAGNDVSIEVAGLFDE